MNARTIGDLLTEFTPRRRPDIRAAERVVPFEPRSVRPSTAAPPPAALRQEPPSAPPVKVVTEDAYERGKKDGHAAAIADCEDKLREYGLVSAKRRAEERERWVAEQSTILARQIEETSSTLESRLADTVARLLEPLVVTSIRRQAVEEFAAHLKAVIADSDHPVLCIGGPADLLDAIRSKVDGDAVALQYVPQSSGEVRLATDQVILETQMQVWIDRLRHAMA